MSRTGIRLVVGTTAMAVTVAGIAGQGVSARAGDGQVRTGQAAQVGSLDYMIVAYDTATGAVRWTARYDGPAQDTDAASAMAVSPDGHRIYVTGTSKGASTIEDFVTVAFSG